MKSVNVSKSSVKVLSVMADRLVTAVSLQEKNAESTDAKDNSQTYGERTSAELA